MGDPFCMACEPGYTSEAGADKCYKEDDEETVEC